MTKHSATLQERFDAHSIPEPNSGCLLWIGASDHSGYGQLRFQKRNRVATHIALELVGKPVPAGMFACHRCDNPSCVNSDHLFIGNQKQNIRDMVAKGRSNFSGLVIGRRVKLAKEKEQARRLFKLGYSPTQIATQVGTSATNALQWMQEWGHVSVAQKLRTHCPAGHKYTAENTYIGPKNGDRQCRECKRIWDRKYKQRKRSA